MITPANRNEAAAAKGRFGFGDSNTARSAQNSTCHPSADASTADRDHAFRLRIPQNRTIPAAPQPDPVSARYRGLRRASNSERISHQRIAANKRTAPHTVSINTSHSSRVTPKGRLGGWEGSRIGITDRLSPNRKLRPARGIAGAAFHRRICRSARDGHCTAHRRAVG